MQQKTHREIRNPQISARHLADFMAASEVAKRSIVRNCKYQPIVRVIQHDEAKLSVAKFIRDGNPDTNGLLADAARLRERLADSDFDRDVLDHNADYIDRFAAVASSFSLPVAERMAPGKTHPLALHGVKITTEIHFRLRRVTKTNKVRIGVGALRYAKGKPLAREVADWHSAFLFGYLEKVGVEDGADPERQLCLVVDAYTGTHYSAPGDAVRRFLNMAAACHSIAERWPNVTPPEGAVI